MPATLPPAASVDEALQRLTDVGTALNEEFIERRDVIQALLNAWISKKHVYLLGPPGVGKSALIERMIARIADLPEEAYFRWLFTKFTDPNEVFGPPSLRALKEDSYVRITRGKLPEAIFAFCDECLTADTQLLLPGGRRAAISDVQRDLPSLLSLTESGFASVQPLDWVERLPSPTSELRLGSGQTIKVTNDHKFLARRLGGHRGGAWHDWSEPTWTEATDLSRGDFVATPNETPIFGSDVMPTQEVDLLAYLISEGGLTRPTIRLTSADPVIVEDMRACVESLGDRLVHVDRYNYRCVGPNQNVRRFAQRFNLFGVKSPQRWLPEAVHTLARPHLARFIGRLWSCDGRVSAGNGAGTRDIYYATSSPVLAEQLQHLCRRFGVVTRRTEYDILTPAGKPTSAWRVQVRGGYYERFAKEFGPYLIGDKALVCANTEWTPQVSDRRLCKEGDIQWEPVESVTPCGFEPTYCFTMPTGNFVAEDILVKNCFKANSAILNSLLTVMNERLFFNGIEKFRVPLRNLYAASNEMPQGDELTAMYDRIHFRFNIKPLQSSSSFIRMLSLEWEDNPAPLITLDDITTLGDAAKALPIPVEVYEAMRSLREELRREGLEPTERRFRECLDIIKATALMSGADAVEVEHMADLKHTLWDRVEHIPVVSRAVLALANPLDREAQDLLDLVDSIGTDIDKLLAQGDSPQAIARSAVEYFTKMKKVKKEVKTLVGKFRSSGRTGIIIGELTSRYEEVAKTLQERCFGGSEMTNLDQVGE